MFGASPRRDHLQFENGRGLSHEEEAVLWANQGKGFKNRDEWVVAEIQRAYVQTSVEKRIVAVVIEYHASRPEGAEIVSTEARILIERLSANKEKHRAE